MRDCSFLCGYIPVVICNMGCPVNFLGWRRPFCKMKRSPQKTVILKTNILLCNPVCVYMCAAYYIWPYWRQCSLLFPTVFQSSPFIYSKNAQLIFMTCNLKNLPYQLISEIVFQICFSLWRRHIHFILWRPSWECGLHPQGTFEVWCNQQRPSGGGSATYGLEQRFIRYGLKLTVACQVVPAEVDGDTEMEVFWSAHHIQ